MTKLTTLNVDTTPLDFAPWSTALQVEITEPIPFHIGYATPSISNEAPKVSQTPKLPHIRQSEALNVFNRIRFENYKICEFKGNFIIQNITKTGMLTITIKPPIPLSKISVIPPSTRPSMHRLFRSIIFKFTEHKSYVIELSLAEYMKLCGLTDQKEARRQVNHDLDLLSKVSLSYEAKENNKKTSLGSFNETPICKPSPTIKNSIIRLELTEAFFKYLSSCPTMPIFDWVFKIDMRREPHAYYVANSILEHANKNSGKTNADIISVRTLLNACPMLSKEKRRFWQSIKKPFEKVIEYLENCGIELTYYNKSREPLTDRQLNKLNDEANIKMSYDEFLNLRIIYKFTTEEYPARKTKKPRAKSKKKFRKQPKYKKLGG